MCLGPSKLLEQNIRVTQTELFGNSYLKTLMSCTLAVHGIKCLHMPSSFHFSVMVRASSLYRHNCLCIFSSALFPASSIFMSYNEKGNNLIGAFYISVFKFSKHFRHTYYISAVIILTIFYKEFLICKRDKRHRKVRFYVTKNVAHR